MTSPEQLPAGWDGTELGTAIDHRLFNTFQDGRVYDYGQPRPADYDAMLTQDGKAHSVEKVLTLPLHSAPRSIKAAKGDRGEAEAITAWLTRPANTGGMTTPLDLLISQMTAAITYRRVYFEKAWKIDDDGHAVYDHIGWRPPQSCVLTRNPDSGQFTGFKQYVGSQHPGADGMGYVQIPPGRAFVHLNATHRNPTDGRSDLDVCYHAWATKQKIRFLWHQFLENESLPKVIATHGTKGDREGKGLLARKIASLKNGGVVAIDPDQKVTALPTGTGAQFKDALDYLDGEMAGSVLASFLELAGASKGSYALSKDQTDMFLQSRMGTLREMGASFTSWVIADMVRWNFGPDAAVPTLEFGTISGEDAAQTTALLQALAATPIGQARIPAEFLDELTVKVASYLELSVDKVQAAITQAQASAPPTPLAQTAQAVDTATALVQQAKTGAPA